MRSGPESTAKLWLYMWQGSDTAWLYCLTSMGKNAYNVRRKRSEIRVCCEWNVCHDGGYLRSWNQRKG